MKNGQVVEAMISYLKGNRHEIEHFLKVYGYAKAIGECEGLSAEEQEILEIAAIVHDIGIPKAMAIYNSDAGKYQEQLGPAEAGELLEKLHYSEKLIERVCYLVGHHHTYTEIDGIDYRILLEADFLVNASHNNYKRTAIELARENFFRTHTGIVFLNALFEL